MADYRDFDIEMTIVPDVAGQYEAAFVIHEARGGRQQAGDAAAGRYAFPPVGSYPTPDDAREQTGAWVRKWIDLNFPKQAAGA